MRCFELLRNSAFWFADSLKNNAVLKHIAEIQLILNGKNPDIAERIKTEHLNNLISHAVNSTLFYRGFKKKSSLQEFPVVNKNIIKESSNDFLSKNYKSGDLYAVTTSGSTGTPFKTYQDKTKKLRNYADTIYFGGLAGYEPGHRLLYLKIWVKDKMHSRLEYWLQNIVPIDVINLNDNALEDLIKKIERNRSTFGIIGYASALELICRFLDRKHAYPVMANVKSIIAISESLNNYTKNTMEKYFGISAVSRYSNLENGIIAQQILHGENKFLLNTASYHIEILKLDSNETAREGEMGRIVITDLFNYAMPLIRYDTGDIGVKIEDYENSNQKYLSKIEGRKLDLLYNTNGELVSSFLVYKNMWQYTEIDQYQLVQENANQYTFKINAKASFAKEAKLIAEFKTFLGKDADFRIEYVSEIPLLDSGKRRKIVNNWIKP